MLVRAPHCPRLRQQRCGEKGYSPRGTLPCSVPTSGPRRPETVGGRHYATGLVTTTKTRSSAFASGDTCFYTGRNGVGPASP